MIQSALRCINICLIVKHSRLRHILGVYAISSIISLLLTQICPTVPFKDSVYNFPVLGVAKLSPSDTDNKAICH